MCYASNLEKKGLDAVLRANNIEKEVEQSLAKQEMVKKKKEDLKIQIEDEKILIRRLEPEVFLIEQHEKCLKYDEQIYRSAHRIAQAEVENVGTQVKEARALQREIEWRKNEALQGIESTT